MKFNSKKQIRIDILSQYLSGRLYYRDAINALEVSERHFRRLVKEFRADGFKSVIHKNTGKAPPNKVTKSKATKIIRLYKSVYKGLNVTHFIEKLKDCESITPPSYSTVRRLLLEEKLIGPSQKRKKRAYARRHRYEREGLMVQIDGSHHRWLHGAEMMCLTAAIDDATGKILGAKFTPTETTFAAMDVTEQIINQYGLFQMLYSDRAGIYGGGKREGYSNMNRAMRELGIIPVQASTPQGKGRIERLFGTLQDRLCSEMRLAGVKNIDEANTFLKDYLKAFNEKFGVPALNPEPSYRKLDKEINLDEIFTMLTMRKVQSGHIVSWNSKKYLLKSEINLIGKEAEIKEYRDGRMEIHVLGEKIDYEYMFNLRKAA